jgi:NAD-dependent deacetylase
MEAATPGNGEIAELRRVIDRSARIVALTGAGISTESGIPDFRGPGGTWSRIRPITFDQFVSSEEARMEDWRRRFVMNENFAIAEPNAGHLGLVELAREGRLEMLVTQNIDGLHQRAGFPPDRLIEIHGNATHARCLDCGSRMELSAARAIIEASGASPRCGCGGLVKAAIISFGQQMPEAELHSACEHARSADLFLVIGSSLQVRPAASLPVLAKQAGATPRYCERRAYAARSRWRTSSSANESGPCFGPSIHNLLISCRAASYCGKIVRLVARLQCYRGSNQKAVQARARLTRAAGSDLESSIMGAKPTADSTPDIALQDEAPVDLVEVSGVIKWFDVAKGYGFVVPDGGGEDILLHVSCLRRDGFQTAYEGARIVCEVLDRPKGRQAFRVLSMDESSAAHPSQLPPTRQRSAVVPTSPLVAATVKWFNRMRGYGFLSEGEGRPRYLRPYGNAAPLPAITELRPGPRVMVRYGEGPKGNTAAEIRPDSGGHIPVSH